MNRAAVAGALALAPSCTPLEPELVRVEPPRGLNHQTTNVALLGRDLDPPIREDGAHLIPEAWTGSVGPARLERVKWISPERIEAEIPAGLAPGAHDVLLTSKDRELRLVRGFVSVVPVTPNLEEIVPSRVGLEGATVEIVGVGLHYGAVVRVGGQPAPSTWKDDQHLRATVPPAAAPGAVDVEVETPVGLVMRSDLFSYTAP